MTVRECLSKTLEQNGICNIMQMRVNRNWYPAFFFKPLILSVKFRVSINRNSKGKDQQAGQKRLRMLSAWKLDSVQTVFETIRTTDLGQYTDLLIYVPEGTACFFLFGSRFQAPSCRTRGLMDTLLRSTHAPIRPKLRVRVLVSDLVMRIQSGNHFC